MKMSIKAKSLLVGSLGAVMGLTAAPSHADIFATSKLVLNNFIINGSDGNPLDAGPGGDFATLNFTGSADMNGDLTGTPGFSFSVPNGTQTDFAASCVSTTGNCNPVLPENTFPLISGAQGTDYIAGDQQEINAPVDNLLGFNPVAGADIGQVTAGSLSATNATGSANVNQGLEANWEFSLAQAQGISFTGVVTAYLEAFAGAGEQFPGKASAAITFSITITDVQGGQGGGTVFSFTPAALNQTASANAGGFGFDIQQCGTFTCGTELVAGLAAGTGPLLANNLYQLSLRQNINIDIAREEVPTPGTLALLGMGLLGLTLRRRRRA